jgi:hypothetical protein
VSKRRRIRRAGIRKLVYIINVSNDWDNSILEKAISFFTFPGDSEILVKVVFEVPYTGVVNFVKSSPFVAHRREFVAYRRKSS